MTDQRQRTISRRTVLGGIGTGIVAGFAGCTGGGNGSDETATTGSDGTTSTGGETTSGGGGTTASGSGVSSQQLDYWLFGGAPAEREYISSHYDEYGEHEISYQHQEWGQKYQIIASAAANSNLPDVMAGQGQQIPDYVDASAIQPLNQDAFADRIEAMNEPYIEANLDTLRFSGLGEYDEEMQWAMPGGYADLGPFIDIRTEYLEQTSFDGPPRTWEEFLQLAQEMQELDEVSAAVTTSGTDFGLTTGYFIGWVYANGGRYFDPDSLEATVDGPGFVDAVKLYQDIAEAGLFPDSVAENDHIAAGRLLTEGESGIFITYSHTGGVYDTIGADQSFLDGNGHITTRAPLPKSPSGDFEPQNLLLQNATAQMMARGTANDNEQQAAFDYIEWWSQPEQLAPWTYTQDADVGIRGRIPTLKSAFENPSDIFRNQYSDVLTLYENDNLFDQTSRFPSFSGLSSVQSEINTQVLQPVMLGNATAEEACSGVNSAIQEIIDENMG